MTAGLQPNINNINASAGAIALGVQKYMQAVIDFNDYITALGGVDFLSGDAGPTGIGMTPTDAATMVSTYGNLVAVAKAYQGNGIIVVAFDYEENSQLLLGPPVIT
jgi:hypothetical protein